jgi:hypothetical protein
MELARGIERGEGEGEGEARGGRTGAGELSNSRGLGELVGIGGKSFEMTSSPCSGDRG